MTIAEFYARAPGSLLLASELVMFWSVANYATTSDPVQETRNNPTEKRSITKFWATILLFRSVCLGIALLAIAGVGRGSVALAVTLVATCILLPLARGWWIAAKYGAELEIGAIVVAVLLIVGCVAHWHLTVVHGYIDLPFGESRTSALCLITAIVVFNLRGGTYVVRGLLNKCGALPELTFPQDTVTRRPNNIVANEKSVDIVEFNRGRWIGNLERILLLPIFAEGHYSAVAFLMAAKGIIRSKDLENREWAEYFLLGSLASIAVALVGGLCIRQVLSAFW